MIEASRREFIQSSGLAAVGAAIASNWAGRPKRRRSPKSSSFDIDKSFAKFMQEIGGTPADGGGAVTFVGSDPIVRSHFRIGACMAIPAMGAATGAAAIWRDRTGQARKPRDVATTARWEFALEFEERPATRRAHPTLRNLVFTEEEHMIGKAKIDRRTLLAGAEFAALAPVAAHADTANEGMSGDVATALARFRSSIPSNFDRDYVENAVVPFFLESIYQGERPVLPMIDVP